MEAFSVDHLTFSYPGQSGNALEDVRFSVRQGEFLALCGSSGCGKSTLLRHFKTALAPQGMRRGTILFMGLPLGETVQREQSARIGFVQQSPENQIVTDKVWHELAFGLESLGYDTPSIRGRVAETASFFGIESWFYKGVTELSGGQKQLLNLASVMVMQPSVLILDEPTSQLDPIAASGFLAAVGRVNRELGVTVIVAEQRLEEVFPLSDRVLVMDAGKIIADGTPCDVGERLKGAGHAMFSAIPAAMRVWASVDSGTPCPVTVREGRDWLVAFAAKHTLGGVPQEQHPRNSGAAAIALSDVWFRYEKDLPDVVKGLSVTVRKGELFTLLGGNGTGKTTALSIIGGLRKAYRGDVHVCGSIGMLPQNPQALFVKKTVREDLYEQFRGMKLSPAEMDIQVARVTALCRLAELLDRHPYDLSGGEQQRAALAKVLLPHPDILLLDEPTKGMDARFKQSFAQILKALMRRGVTILMVSHDVEFCAEYADRCALFFDGNIVTEGTPRKFFSGNSFYTTSANRIARAILPEAITASDIISACGGDIPATPESEGATAPSPSPAGNRAGVTKFSWWRQTLAALSGALAVSAFIKAVAAVDLSALQFSGGVTRLAGESMGIYTALIAALFIFALATSRKAPGLPYPARNRQGKRSSSKRGAAALMILLLIPLTILFGVYCLNGKKYYFIALLILLEAMLPFFLIFEGRKPPARELAVIAVLCAIGVAGRAAFFMLPSFKPVMAVVIVAGVALGGETGFLVGAVTMLTSNILFGQGPWTPWQMFAMGLVGFLAGFVFRPGGIRCTRLSLCAFGALSAVILYGGIMNPASALMWTHMLDWKILLSYYVTGFPLDCVHAAATAIFLWFGAEPMLEKLERIKVKYGFAE